MLISDEILSAARVGLVNLVDDATLIEAAALLSAGTDLIVVCGPDGTLAGVITKTDIVAQICVCNGSACTIAASTVMSREVALCRATDRLEDIADLVKKRGLKNVPIVDDQNRPVGLLTARDVLRALLRDAEYDEALLID
jgi:predicted transcriptional regulator